MIKDNPRIQLISAAIFLFLIFLVQWVLFSGYVERELAWSPFLKADANWYLGHSYIVFDSILKEGKIPHAFFNDPAGIMVLLFSSALYLIFGASRHLALLTNFIPYLLLQVFIFYMGRRLTKSWIFASALLGLFLTAAVPFQVVKSNLLAFMEYQRDFGVFCFFGIFIISIFFSDTFLKNKWSIGAGMIAGFIVCWRYNALFHLLGIYLLFFATMICILFIKNKDVEISVIYKKRLINGIFSCFSMGAVSSYPIWRARYALYNHYFAGKLIGPKNESFIEIYQHGVKNLWQQIIYYPKFILNSGLGETFYKAATVFAVILVIIIIVVRLLKQFQCQTENNSVQNSENFGALIFYWFIGISSFAPLLLLTVYPVRSANVGILVAAPFIIFVCVSLAHLYNKVSFVSSKKVMIPLAICAAFISLILGAYFQKSCYSVPSFSSLNKKYFLEVARMYDDIIIASKKNEIIKPGISVNFSENYVLGCGEAITAYQYEHTGELFRVQAKLGSDIGRGYDLDEAVKLIMASEFMLLDTSDPPKGTHTTGNYGFLAHNLAVYPFAKSMYKLRPEIREHVEKNFRLISRYSIFDRKVELYENKRMAFIPAIKSSSQMNDHHSADTILKSASTIWHSKPGPAYPQWLEFTYKYPVVINSISIICQIGAPDRGPGEFYLQGLDETGTWKNLLEVPDVGFKNGDEIKSWPVKNIIPFNKYRVYITKNNGAHNLLTIQQVIFSYKENTETIKK